MASFSRPTFAFNKYAAFRPSYPPELFRTVLDYYHNGSGDNDSAGLDGDNKDSKIGGTLLEIGTGHGVVARSLAPHFDIVHAIDRSEGMVAQARVLLEGKAVDNIRVQRGQAEDLSFLPDGSVDLVVAAQAAHWFDFEQTWPELSRVVRSGGAVAFWGYKNFVLLGHPASSAVLYRFMYGEGKMAPGIEGLREFWEEPGSSVLRASLVAVIPPEPQWTDVDRLVWDPDLGAAEIPEGAPPEMLWMRRKMTLGEMEGFIRTFSAVENWRVEHPAILSRAEGGSGDVVDHMFDQAVAANAEWAAREKTWREIEVDIVWGTVILLARRR